MSTVVDSLLRTSKGQLQYDSKWREDGRTEEIVNSIKESVSSIRFAPKVASSPSLTSNSTTQRTMTISKKDLFDISSSSNADNDGCHSSTKIIHDFAGDDSRKYLFDSTASSTNIANGNVSINTVTISRKDELDLIKDYEQERAGNVQRKMQEIADQLLRKNESLMEKIQSEMNLIHRKYLLMSIQNQKNYEEEYAQLNREFEQLPKSSSADGDGSAANKGANLRLKELEEKQKRLEKQKENKRLEQQQYRQTLNECKITIGNVIMECTQTQQQSPQFSSIVINELSNYVNLLIGLVQDVDMILLTKNEFSHEHVQAAQQSIEESERIKLRFVETIQQQAIRSQQGAQQPLQLQPQLTNIPAVTGSSLTSQTATASDIGMITSDAASHKTKIDDENEFTASPNSIYIRTQQELIEFEEKCKNFVNRCDKKRRMELQKAIRTTVNTMCNASDHSYQAMGDLKAKTGKLLMLFKGKFPGIACDSNDFSLHFAINDTAKCFLNVSAKQKNMSLQLAPVIAILWSKCPIFGKIFIAQLFRNCPYAIPYYPALLGESQTEVEYKVTCGYQLNAEGKTESDGVFQERMFAYMQLYAGVMQCNLIRDHPRDLQYVWNWLARVLNHAPQLRITALMLDACLSVSGHKLLRIYGKQFEKLVRFISKVYYRKMEEITPDSERQTLMKFRTVLTDLEQAITQPNGARVLTQSLTLVPDTFFQAF